MAASAPAPTKRNLGTLGIVLLLVLAFLGGLALLGYVGYQILSARALKPSGQMLALSPQATATVTATPLPSATVPAPTNTPVTPEVTPTPLKAPTLTPTPGADTQGGDKDLGASLHNEDEGAEPSPGMAAADANLDTGGDDRLPQTGAGLVAPLGLAFGGLALGLHWLRRRK